MDFLTEASGPPITETPSPGWIFERIEEWNRQFPNRFAFAIDQQDSVQEYGYADVLAYASEIATLLEEKGAKAGDRVGILMENIPQWVFVLLGAMRLRAVAVPLATTLPESSVQLIAEHAGCIAIFADQSNFEKASSVAKRLGCAALPALKSAIQNLRSEISPRLPQQTPPCSSTPPAPLATPKASSLPTTT